MIGMKFNRLTVLYEVENKNKNQNHKKYMCSCDCGKQIVTDKYKLIDGHTKSCGCLKLEMLAERKTTHGQSKTASYKSWSEMRNRCNNPKNHAYKDYGQRGIKICDRWDSFENFISDLGERPNKQYSLDRIDVNQGYSPENCRWATWSQQQNNRRTTKYIEYKSEKMSVKQFSNLIGVPYSTVHRHLFAYKKTPDEIAELRTC